MDSRLDQQVHPPAAVYKPAAVAADAATASAVERRQSLFDRFKQTLSPLAHVAKRAAALPTTSSSSSQLATFTVRENGQLYLPVSVQADDTFNVQRAVGPTQSLKNSVKQSAVAAAAIRPGDRSGKQIKPSDRDTVTYVGFVDFTTVIDNTVVIFEPKQGLHGINVAEQKSGRHHKKKNKKGSVGIIDADPSPPSVHSGGVQHLIRPSRPSTLAAAEDKDNEDDVVVATADSGAKKKSLKDLLAANADRRNKLTNRLRPSNASKKAKTPAVKSPRPPHQAEATTTHRPEHDRSDVELVYKTLFTTYTYFTTFFSDSSTRVRSREETVSAVQTMTSIIKSADLLSLQRSCVADSTCTFSDHSRPPVAGSIGRPTSSHTFDVSQSLAFAPVNVVTSQIWRTFFTTYTYFTTMIVDGTSSVSTRTEIYSNLKSTNVLVTVTETPSLSRALSPTAAASSATRPAGGKRLQYSSISRDASMSDADAAPTNAGKRFVKSLAADFDESIGNNEQHVVHQRAIESKPIVASTAAATAAAAKPTEAAVGMSTAMTTLYTTYTYFTTLFNDGTSRVTSNYETVTNMVTAVDQAVTQEPSITFYTTFTYWTTLFEGDATVIKSSEETKTDIVPTASLLHIASDIVRQDAEAAGSASIINSSPSAFTSGLSSDVVPPVAATSVVDVHSNATDVAFVPRIRPARLPDRVISDAAEPKSSPEASSIVDQAGGDVASKSEPPARTGSNVVSESTEKPVISDAVTVPVIIPIKLRRPNPLRRSLKERQKKRLESLKSVRDTKLRQTRLQRIRSKDSADKTVNAGDAAASSSEAVNKSSKPKLPSLSSGPNTPIFISALTQRMERRRIESSKAATSPSSSSSSLPLSAASDDTKATDVVSKREQIPTRKSYRERARERISRLFRRARPKSSILSQSRRRQTELLNKQVGRDDEIIGQESRLIEQIPLTRSRGRRDTGDGERIQSRVKRSNSYEYQPIYESFTNDNNWKYFGYQVTPGRRAADHSSNNNNGINVAYMVRPVVAAGVIAPPTANGQDDGAGGVVSGDTTHHRRRHDIRRRKKNVVATSLSAQEAVRQQQHQQRSRLTVATDLTTRHEQQVTRRERPYRRRRIPTRKRLLETTSGGGQDGVADVDAKRLRLRPSTSAAAAVGDAVFERGASSSFRHRSSAAVDAANVNEQYAGINNNRYNSNTNHIDPTRVLSASSKSRSAGQVGRSDVYAYDVGSRHIARWGNHQPVRRQHARQDSVPTEITVTHYVPVRTKVPHDGALVDLLTSTASLEVVPASALKSTDVSETAVIYANAHTVVASHDIGQQTVIFDGLRATESTAVDVYETQIRGYRTRVTQVVPTTVYNVLSVTTVLPRSVDQYQLLNNLLANLLGQRDRKLVNDKPLTGLRGNGDAGRLDASAIKPTAVRLDAGEPGDASPAAVQAVINEPTSYITHFNTITVTSTTEESSVIPITFRGRKVLTTLVTPHVFTLTSTLESIETVINHDALLAARSTASKQRSLIRDKPSDVADDVEEVKDVEEIRETENKSADKSIPRSLDVGEDSGSGAENSVQSLSHPVDPLTIIRNLFPEFAKKLVLVDNSQPEAEEEPIAIKPSAVGQDDSGASADAARSTAAVESTDESMVAEQNQIESIVLNSAGPNDLSESGLLMSEVDQVASVAPSSTNEPPSVAPSADIASPAAAASAAATRSLITNIVQVDGTAQTLTSTIVVNLVSNVNSHVSKSVVS